MLLVGRAGHAGRQRERLGLGLGQEELNRLLRRELRFDRELQGLCVGFRQERPDRLLRRICRRQREGEGLAAGMPAFCSSPTIGPGLNGVSPARTHKSSGATSPPLAGARVFVPSSSLNKRNGLMSAVTTAVWPSIVSPSFTRSGFFALACSSASRSRLFLATVIVARPQSFL